MGWWGQLYCHQNLIGVLKFRESSLQGRRLGSYNPRITPLQGKEGAIFSLPRGPAGSGECGEPCRAPCSLETMTVSATMKV